jgi:heat shock protein HspQ
MDVVASSLGLAAAENRNYYSARYCGSMTGGGRVSDKLECVEAADRSTDVTTAHKHRTAKFKIGEIVRHRIYPFRGVVFDVDPIFANTEEWWLSIPEEIRPAKDQPFYHLLAENSESEYVAYVSEQNLVRDTSGEPIRHPDVEDYLEQSDEGDWTIRRDLRH